MKTYPGEGEADKIYAIAGALDLDADAMRTDGAALADWAKSQTEDSLMTACENPSAGRFNQMLSDNKSNKLFLHSRATSIGLFKCMEMAGVEPSKEAIDKYAPSFGLPAARVNQDFDLYAGAIE